ncbi:FAD-binding protein [Deltaproteobacteria bacterium]|nr:FAD-binding protein [Deltaproteobacteria bacterium]
MTKPDDLGKVIETDVLIIGGGVSGLWAANRARKSLERVMIVDKGPRDWGGQASMAGGDFDAALPGENIDDYVKDLVYYYDGLCDQEIIEEVFRQSYDRLQDYQRLGCEFLTGPDGKLKGIPQRSLNHIKLYPAQLKTRGGPDMVRGLVKEADRLGVERLGRLLITDLLKGDGKVVGAVGFHQITGEFYIFKTGAVVLASGQGGWKSTRAISSGEGMWMAAKAGVELRNCEFANVHNQPRLFEWEGQTKLLPLGARFVNASGESYMDNYSPKFGANTDPHYNIRGMAVEAREGRGPIYLDISQIKSEDLDLVKPQSGWQLLNYEKLVKLGIDFFKEKTEWMPQPVALYGGIIADLKGRTLVPGLFVAGRIRSIDAGVYMGGFALCTTAVTGHIAGESVATYALSNRTLPIDMDKVAAFKKDLFNPLGKTGITPKEVLTEIQQAVFPYDVCILKNEDSLKRALDKIIRIKEELLPRTTARDPHYLMKLVEAQGITFITECYLRASLMRTESRAGHYREDHPYRNDEEWLKWIVISLKENNLSLRTDPVPLDRYKFKPTRYYMDNFKFP